MDTPSGYVPDYMIRGPVMGRAYTVPVGDREHRCTVVGIVDSRVTVRTETGMTFATDARHLIAADAEAWARADAAGED